MSKFILFFLPLLITVKTFGQLTKPTTPNCLDLDTWSQLSLVTESTPQKKAPDLLVITNRPLHTDSEEFFPNAISTHREMSYVLASCTGTKWDLHLASDLMSALKAVDNGRDILLFVHGHGKSFPSAIKRAYKVSQRYNVTVILFDWPAQNSNFNKSLARIRRCSGNFYNVLLQLDSYRNTVMKDDQKLSLLAHSLGNYFISYLVVGGNYQFITTPIFDNVIFNSPAIRSKEHGEVLQHLALGKRSYVIGNKKDRILRSAHMLTSGKMLGNVVIPPYVEGFKYFDFTDIADGAHTFFAGNFEFEDRHPFVFDFFNQLVHGNEFEISTNVYLLTDDIRPVYKVIMPDNMQP